MKKIIFLALLCVAATSCNSLKIAQNYTKSSGERVVLTTNTRVFNSFMFALGAQIKNGETSYAVLITSDKQSNHGIFDHDDRLQIRLADESVITLKNLYHKEYDKETKTGITNDRVTETGYAYTYGYFGDVYVVPYEVSAFVPHRYVETNTYSYALYTITAEQIQQIINKGVVKLRVEVENDYFDMKNPESFSSTMQKLNACLQDGIAKGSTFKEF